MPLRLQRQQEDRRWSNSEKRFRSRLLRLRCVRQLLVEKRVSYAFRCESPWLITDNLILEFDLDSDELDETSVQDLGGHNAIPQSPREQQMPLLVGLFDSSASRRSLDASMQMNGTNGNSVIIGEDTLDLEELAAKRTAGGGLADSIANMANSILGAGARPSSFVHCYHN